MLFFAIGLVILAYAFVQLFAGIAEAKDPSGMIVKERARSLILPLSVFGMGVGVSVMGVVFGMVGLTEVQSGKRLPMMGIIFNVMVGSFDLLMAAWLCYTIFD